MKVVTPQEMKRIEAESYREGSLDQLFMEKAGEAIALAAMKHLEGRSRIIVVVGNGNNGGDGLVAARLLLERGFNVLVLPLFSKDEGSDLYKKQFAAYKGRLIDKADFQKDDLIIVAIFGTGFKGALEGSALEMVLKINKSSAYTIAVDIPSGLDGTTGEVKTEALKASLTVTLGLPKTGFFKGAGFECLGELEIASFGLPQKYVDLAKAEAELFVKGESFSLPLHKRTWHKYSRGYVTAFAGSLGMMGAAALACKAALRTGAGIVRLFCEKEKVLLESLPTEVLTAFFDEGVEAELKRSSAFMAGPGIGRQSEVGEKLKKLIASVQKPMVLDADALWWLSQGAFTAPPKCVLTPHQGEMERLHESPQRYADRFDLVIVLKGAPTILFSQGRLPLIIAQAPSIMATAGSGDVLTGVIASLMAQGLDSYEAAKTGVLLHSEAGKIAEKKMGYGAIAGDFVECLPLALKALSGMHKS